MPIFPFFQSPYINRYYPRYNYNNYNNYNNHDTYNNLDTHNNHNNCYMKNHVCNLNNDNTEKGNTSPSNKPETNSHSSNEQTQKNKSPRYSGFGPIHFQNPFDLDSEQPVLEILGISLYLDDLIILGLLFFLYKEQVQDEMLFISLILLLLT